MTRIEIITPNDIKTREGWEEELAYWRTHLEKHNTATEMTLHTSLIWITRDVFLGTPLPEPQLHILTTKFNGTEGEVDRIKAEFEFYLRSFSLAGAAVASAFLTETWIGFQKFGSGEHPVPFPPGYRPSKDPKRREALYLPSQHRFFGRRSWMAMINKTGGKRSLEPWTLFQETQAFRFVSVPPDKMLENQLLTQIAVHYLDSHRDMVINVPPPKRASA